MKKLLATVLTLALCCSVGAPALAYQDTDPPLWQQWGFDSLEEMLEETYRTEEEYGREAEEAAREDAWRAEYWARHAAEFDADAWYEEQYDYEDKEDYMASWELDEAGFQEEMKESWLSAQFWDYNDRQKVESWAAEHPEEYAAFDPDEYFDQVFNARGDWNSKEEYMGWYPVTETEEDFRQEMLVDLVTRWEAKEERQAAIDAWAAQHPEELAAFDPMDWFQRREGDYWTVEEYMEVFDLADQEDFQQYMTWDWVTAQDMAQRRQARADAWELEHPEEAAAFDPEAWFESHLLPQGYESKEEYMTTLATGTQEEFRTDMLLSMLDFQGEMEDTRALVEEWKAEHPEEYAAFDPRAWFQKQWYYVDESPEEYMESWGLTEEEFRLRMAREYISSWEEAQEDIAGWAAQVAAEPEETAAFLAGVEAWIAENDDYYTSVKDYMDQNDFVAPESVYLMLYSQWKADREEQTRRQVQLDQHKRELGGVPGELSVMLNGTYLQFPDAKPMAREERTMIPVRALAETLGYQVSYDPDQAAAVCVRGETTVTFPLEGGRYTVTGAGETGSEKMSAPAFAQEGRIYIPLRDLAEALGCDVAWDGDYQTAVLFDPQAAAQTLNQDFTQLDQMVSTLVGKALDTAQRNVETTASETIQLTLFNSLDGDKRYDVTVKGTVTAGKGAVAARLEANLAQVLSQITPQDWARLTDLMEENGELTLDVNRLKALLKNGLALDLLWNAQEGSLYVRCPLLSLLLPQVGAEDWVSVDLDLPYTELVPGAALPAGEVDKNGQAESLGLLDLGSYLYDQEIGQWMDSSWSYRAPGVDSYAQLMEAAQPYIALLGDERFVREEGKVTYTLDTDLVNGLIREATAPDPDDFYSYDPFQGQDAFRDCQVSLTVYDDGDYQGSVNLRMNPLAAGLVDFLFTWEGESRNGAAAQDMEFHFKNLFDLTVTGKSQTKQIPNPPVALPPEGAKVVPAEDLQPW